MDKQGDQMQDIKVEVIEDWQHHGNMILYIDAGNIAEEDREDLINDIKIMIKLKRKGTHNV